MAKILRGKNPVKQYTLRYRLDGRQRERSFRTYREAADFGKAVEYQSREQTSADPQAWPCPRHGVRAQVLAGMDLADGTRLSYLTTLNRWVSALASAAAIAALALRTFPPAIP